MVSSHIAQLYSTSWLTTTTDQLHAIIDNLYRLMIQAHIQRGISFGNVFLKLSTSSCRPASRQN